MPEISSIPSEAAASLKHLAAGFCFEADKEEGSPLMILQRWLNSDESIDSEIEAVTKRILSSINTRGERGTYCLSMKKRNVRMYVRNGTSMSAHPSLIRE